jgi:separase
LSTAQAIYLQEHDVLEKKSSSSKLQHKTRINVLFSSAYTIHSMLAAERGVGQIALSDARKNVRLLRRAWFNIASEIPNRNKTNDSFTDIGVEKLCDETSQLSLVSNETYLAGTCQEFCVGTSLWGLITPLFQGLTRLSELFAHHGLFQETIYYAEQADKLAQEVDSDSLQATASVLLGSTWLKAGFLKKGSEFLIHAEQFCSDKHESRDKAVLRYHMGKMHGLLGQEDAAITAYMNAEASLNIITSAEYIRGLERVADDSSLLEDEMARLSLKQKKPAAPRKTTGRPKKTISKKATTRAKSPVETVSPVADECPQLLSFKSVVLRQRARALMTRQNFVDALNLLQEAEIHTTTRVELVDHSLSMAKQLLLQSLEQMGVDPVYSTLQECTISFPSIASAIKSEQHGDKLSGKASPPRKPTAMRAIGDRNGSKSPVPNSFVDKLRQAQEFLVEAHATATLVAPMAVVHNASALLNSVTILLSAASYMKGKSLPHPGLASFSVGTYAFPFLIVQWVLTIIEMARTLALRRERKAILSEPRMTLKLGEAAWPQLQSIEGRRSSLGPACDMSRFQKDFIDIIPKSWSVISISLSNTSRDLCITKLHAGQTPFVLRLPLDRRDPDEELFDFEQGRAELTNIINLANNTAHDACNRIGKEAKIAWWKEREELDARLQNLLQNVERIWLGGFRGVFSQHAKRPNLLARFQKSFQNILDKHLPSRRKTGRRNASPRVTLDARILELFIGLGDLSDDEFALSEPLDDLLNFVFDVLQFQGELNEHSEVEWDSIAVETMDALRGYHEAAKASATTTEKKHTILILDKALQSFPWESLPCMEGLAVSRLPSLGCLRQRILAQDINLSHDGPAGHYINREKGSYILNPGGDLKDTQKTFQTSLRNLNSWNAIISRKPSEEEFKDALTSKDLLLYFGHGSGAQYIRSREIKRLEECAVTFLMGCSSGALIETGEFEPYGAPINYMHAGSPALVATLWDVTDKDIDRFAKSAFEHWGLFEPETGGRGKGEKRDEAGEKVSLVEAVMKARSACHLKYLNAASVVVYGVPVYFR